MARNFVESVSLIIRSSQSPCYSVQLCETGHYYVTI